MEAPHNIAARKLAYYKQRRTQNRAEFNTLIKQLRIDPLIQKLDTLSELRAIVRQLQRIEAAINEQEQIIFDSNK